MTPEQIDALRKSHSPQPTGGRVLHGLHVALQGDTFRIWDSRQTTGYLCSTNDASLLIELLRMEAASQGALRLLITGEPSPYSLAPPTPSQSTYSGPRALKRTTARIDISGIKLK